MTASKATYAMGTRRCPQLETDSTSLKSERKRIQQRFIYKIEIFMFLLPTLLSWFLDTEVDFHSRGLLRPIQLLGLRN